MFRESSSYHPLHNSAQIGEDAVFVHLNRIVGCLAHGIENAFSEEDSDLEPRTIGSKKRKKEKSKSKGKVKATSRPQKRQKREENVENREDIETDKAVPILRHVFEIDCNVRGVPHDTLFINYLRNNFEQDGQDQDKLVFDIGTIYPHASNGLVYACATNPLDNRRKDPTPERIIMTIPKLTDSIYDPDFDFHSKSLQNILAAAYTLQKDKRAVITGNLKFHVQSSELFQEKEELVVSFTIEVIVSLLEPRIFEPVTTFRKKDSEIEEAQRRVLIYVFGTGCDTPKGYGGMTDIPFFLSCLRPASHLTSSKAIDAIQPKDLIPTLLPFQKRSVGWLLSREGKHVRDDGVIEDIGSPDHQSLLWEEVSPSPGTVWYINRLSGAITNELPLNDFRGGILAEEPGLGKTLESIALVMLTPEDNRNPSISRWDAVGVIEVKEVKTTLIITPTSLAQQWADELRLHAPSLKVLVYDGWKNVPVPITVQEARHDVSRSVREKRRHTAMKYEDDDDDIDDEDIDDLDLSAEEKKLIEEASEQITWCEFVQQYDICITTYHTLQQDLGVARAPVVRPRREVANYREIYRDRSPLVMVEWRRVIMDEVQMVGGGKTEEMVSLIPRLSSFAVSGTPARASADDLIHVIRFLRVNEIIDSVKVWTRLLKPPFAGYFKKLFELVSIRTTKAKVQDELTIPQQRRYVVPIELGNVERHVYDQSLEQALRDLGLDARGVATSQGWQVDAFSLRNWLRRLRGICTHPQVGQLKQNDKLAKVNAALKTIEEVHENMKDQNWRAVMDERKSKVLIMIRKSQLVRHGVKNMQKQKESLQILQNALQEMKAIYSEVKDAIKEHNAKGELLKQEAVQAQIMDDPSKSKERHREISEVNTEGSLDDDLPKSAASDEHRAKKSALSSRLREANMVLHQIYFRLGDIYSGLGESYKDKEDESYLAAEQIRKELLKVTEQAALLSIAQLKAVAKGREFNEAQLQVPDCGKGGEKTEGLLREADGIIRILNRQGDVLSLWRQRILKLLTENLSSSDGGDADGGEYARSLETQGEAETFLQALASLLADRREILVQERTALAAHDTRERKVRHTIAARKAQNEEHNRIMDAEEIGPEHEVLQKELNETRKNIMEMHNGRAIKSIVVELQDFVHSLGDKDPEKAVAKESVKKLKTLIKEQTIIHDKFESDMAQFRKAFNDRVQYFRQLQEISDSVAEIEIEGTKSDEIEKTKVEEMKIIKKINELQARARFLKHLVDKEGDEEEDWNCVLCRCDFNRGFVTQCAHVYCEGCLKEWLNRNEGKACPICRVFIIPEQLQRVKMKEKKPEIPGAQAQAQLYQLGDDEEAPRSRRVIEYNTIDKDVYEKIQSLDCLGSFGSKIEMLVKHLLYIEDVDPGSKSIVFSAWADSLFILERALRENGIHCLRIDQKKGKQNAVKLFKNDRKYRVLLLHGERENAGLNVTCASRVFLTESVVQHSFELQAIARIDRLGQTRPTEVYCYYAENTVERNILDLAAKRGRSLYTRDHAVGTVKVTSFDLDKGLGDDTAIKSNKKQRGQKGDFILRTEDMLAILFPHLFEDIEYLLPEGEVQETGGDQFVGDFEEDNDESMDIDNSEQPIAGPSRLD